MDEEQRKCAFTGQSPGAHITLEEDEHSWIKKIPCSAKYYKLRQGELLDDDELAAIQMFFELEVAYLMVSQKEERLKAIQEKIRKKVPVWEKKRAAKNNEIELATIEHEIRQEGKSIMDEVIKDKKTMWG